MFDRIVRLVSTPAHEFGPAISPDGKWVTYLSDARGPTDVWVKFVAGGIWPTSRRQQVSMCSRRSSSAVSTFPPDGPIESPSRPCGRQPAPLQTTWSFRAARRGPTAVLEGRQSGLHWSLDGRRIAFTRPGGSLGDALVVADADGQNEREMVPRQNGRHIHWVRWSHDGQRVYFDYGIQNFNTEPTEVYRASVSGGAIEPVIRSARRAAFPFPSPDGLGLYYAANPDSVDLGLWWRDFRTERDHRLTTGVGEYGAPAVTPDGQRLVATAVDARQSLMRARVTFDKPVELEPLTDGFTGDFNPSWSPGENRLLFSSSRNGNRHIWAASVNLSQPAPLTSGPALDDRPVYAPDGLQVAFVSDRGERAASGSSSADGVPRVS